METTITKQQEKIETAEDYFPGEEQDKTSKFYLWLSCQISKHLQSMLTTQVGNTVLVSCNHTVNYNGNLVNSSAARQPKIFSREKQAKYKVTKGNSANYK